MPLQPARERVRAVALLAAWGAVVFRIRYIMGNYRAILGEKMMLGNRIRYIFRPSQRNAVMSGSKKNRPLSPQEIARRKEAAKNRLSSTPSPCRRLMASWPARAASSRPRSRRISGIRAAEPGACRRILGVPLPITYNFILNGMI